MRPIHKDIPPPKAALKEKFQYSFSEAPPFQTLCQKWRDQQQLEPAERAKRELIMRMLNAFPAPMFRQTMSEFKAAYTVFGKADESRRCLSCMIEEGMVAVSDAKGEELETNAALRAVASSHVRATIWLSSLGVKLWAEQVVDRHKQTLQGHYPISGKLTDKLVGLNFSYKQTPPKKKKSHAVRKSVKIEKAPPPAERVPAPVPAAVEAPVPDSARTSVGVCGPDVTQQIRLVPERTDEAQPNPRMEENRAVPSPVGPAQQSA